MNELIKMYVNGLRIVTEYNYQYVRGFLDELERNAK